MCGGRVLQESKKGLQILDLEGFASLCSFSNMKLSINGLTL